MHIRDDRGPKAFGKRRSLEEPAVPALLPSSLERSRGLQRPVGPLAWAVRMSAILGSVAVFAAYQLAHLSQPGEARARIAFDGRPLLADPETTGAIPPAIAARAARLDPCLLPIPDRPRP
jgi:hypothetical protein